MERLTEWSNNGHGQLLEGDGYTRLAEYEDTGLTPEEIKDLIQLKNALSAAVEQGKYHIRKYERELQDYKYMEKNLSWFCEFMLNMDENNLEELVKAKKEDRLIILPITSGTSIFCDGVVFAPHCAGQIHEVTDWHYSYPMIEKYFHSELDYALDPDEYNRSWFTDKNKCEEYLKKKYNK